MYISISLCLLLWEFYCACACHNWRANLYKKILIIASTIRSQAISNYVMIHYLRIIKPAEYLKERFCSILLFNTEKQNKKKNTISQLCVWIINCSVVDFIFIIINNMITHQIRLGKYIRCPGSWKTTLKIMHITNICISWLINHFKIRNNLTRKL